MRIRKIRSFALSTALLAAVPAGAQTSDEKLNDRLEDVRTRIEKLDEMLETLEDMEDLRARAEQGDVSAQIVLGNMYYNGEGVPEDDREAVRWYRLAAEQGYASAQFALGVMYDNGEGVPEDNREAVRWYQLAAEQGDASAQFNLGVMYTIGEGVPEDYVQAHKWFNIAASSAEADDREKSAASRNLVAALMTPRQIAEAQRLGGSGGPVRPRTNHRLSRERSGGGPTPGALRQAAAASRPVPASSSAARATS